MAAVVVVRVLGLRVCVSLVAEAAVLEALSGGGNCGCC